MRGSSLDSQSMLRGPVIATQLNVRRERRVRETCHLRSGDRSWSGSAIESGRDRGTRRLAETRTMEFEHRFHHLREALKNGKLRIPPSMGESLLAQTETAPERPAGLSERRRNGATASEHDASVLELQRHPSGPRRTRSFRNVEAGYLGRCQGAKCRKPQTVSMPPDGPGPVAMRRPHRSYRIICSLTRQNVRITHHTRSAGTWSRHRGM